MGQYYAILNLTKHEILADPKDNTVELGKLMEFAYTRNRAIKALMCLLEGRWSGDDVIVCGDYFDAGSYKPGDNPAFDRIRKDYPALADSNLYGLAVDRWKPTTITMKTFRRTLCLPRYLVNPDKKVFVDSVKAPIDDIDAWKDDDGQIQCIAWQISPAVLLLACGNGLGGGDYFGNNQNLVGSWATTYDHIWAASDASQIPKTYTEILPDFHESAHPIPCTEKDEAEQKVRDTCR